MKTPQIFWLLLKRVIRVYACFSVVNVFAKLALLQWRRQQAKKAWKHLPGKDSDFKATKLREYRIKFHDFFAEPGLEFPEAPLIKIEAPQPALMCNSEESIKWMLKDEFHNVTKPGSDDHLFELMNEFLGNNGIFVLQHGAAFAQSNETWSKQRKVSSLIFTKANFETVFYDTFIEKGNKVINVLNKVENGEAKDMQELFFSFTMDSIEKFFMGVDVNTVEGGMSEYARSFDSAHQAMMRALTGTVLPQIAARLFLPYPFGNLLPHYSTTGTLAVKLVRWFNKDFQTFKSEVNNLDRHVLKYVRQTRKDPNLSKRSDIIANFLNSKIGNELSDETLRDIVLNLTIAGRDTTACAMTWLLFQLTQNPDVQQRLCEELDSVLKGRVPSMLDLEPENLPYLNGVVFETLRLHPPVPTEVKRVEKDIVYLDGTFVPKGTKLMYSPMAMGRNHLRYPDPMKFDPNRWIPFKMPSLFEFPCFQAGPRFCLGKDMAQMEMKLLIAMIFQKFTFSLKPGEAEKVGYSLMLTQSLANNLDRNNLCLLCIPKKRNN